MRAMEDIARERNKELRAVQQAAYERRYEARKLLFGKAFGMMKNLDPVEQAFVRGVEHEGYEVYLHRVRTGETRWRKRGPKWNHPLNPNRGKPFLNFREWRKIWWKGNKATYRRRDIPKMMAQKFAEMKARAS